MGIFSFEMYISLSDECTLAIFTCRDIDRKGPMVLAIEVRKRRKGVRVCFRRQVSRSPTGIYTLEVTQCKGEREREKREKKSTDFFAI